MTTANMPALRSVKSDVYISQMVNRDLEMVYKYQKDHPVTQLERINIRKIILLLSWRERHISWGHRFSKLESIDVLHTAKLFKYLFTYV